MAEPERARKHKVTLCFPKWRKVLIPAHMTGRPWESPTLSATKLSLSFLIFKRICPPSPPHPGSYWSKMETHPIFWSGNMQRSTCPMLGSGTSFLLFIHVCVQIDLVHPPRYQ